MTKSENIETILIVDDEPAYLQSLKEALENDNLRVVFANSGEDAVSRVEDLIPDLIILDIYMQDMDGFETYRKIRAIKECRDIPVIFLSASDTEEHQLEALKMKAVDYITKPFSPEVVRARVKNHLLINTLFKRIAILEKNLTSEIKQREDLQEELDILLKN